MPGEELVFAGKLLAPHATRIASDLLKKKTLRLRVTWRVYRLTSIRFPVRLYLSWLQSIRSDDLAEPVEAMGPQFAVHLDSRLGASWAWRIRQQRLRDALRIVEATYACLLSLAAETDYRELRERWERRRIERLMQALEELRGASSQAHLGPGEAADLLEREANERRRQRLTALGIEEVRFNSVLEVAPPREPDVPAGEVRVLAAPIGAGKSEMAEAWHIKRIRALRERPETAPIPVWIPARSISGDLVATMRSTMQAAYEPIRRGVALVVDGLDEVGASTAELILSQAGVLVAGSPLSTVLATARPGALSIPESDEIVVVPLTQEDAQALTRAAAGLHRDPTWTWPPALSQSLQRPLFALAAGSLVASGAPLGGHAGLIHALVQQSLRRGEDRRTLSERELFDLLTALAVALAAGRDMPPPASIPEREQLLATRLVVQHGAQLSFSLPIFEQWFAAQALLTQTKLLDGALRSAATFDRWRWSISIATTMATEDQCDDLLARLADFNPGAAAWIVRQVASSGLRPSEDMPPLDPTRARERLGLALMSWVASIGPLASWSHRLTGDGNVAQVGARINGRQVTRAWALTPQGDDLVVPLPHNVTIFGEQNSDWLPISAGPVAPDVAWPWIMIRDDMVRAVRTMLESSRLTTMTGGVWDAELSYFLCRTLVGERSLLHRPIAASRVLPELQEMLAASADPARSVYQIGNRSFSGALIEQTVAWLRDLVGDAVRRPLPTPDVAAPTSSFVWDLYSDTRLLALAVEMYGKACEAYEEVANSVLQSFGWSLGFRAFAPLGVVGQLRLSEQPSHGPVLDYEVLPLEQARHLALPGHFVSDNGRAFIALGTAKGEYESVFEQWREARSELQARATIDGDVSPILRLVSTTTVLHTKGDRLASAEAARWLYKDLANLGLWQGTIPQIQH